MADADVIGMSTHAIAAGGGAGLIGLIARTAITNWFKAHEKREDARERTFEKVAEELKGVAVELGKIGIRLGKIDESVTKTAEHGETIAILGTRMAKAEENLNGLGRKIRAISTERPLKP